MTNKVSPTINPSDNVFHSTSSSLKVAKGWLAVAFIYNPDLVVILYLTLALLIEISLTV